MVRFATLLLVVACVAVAVGAAPAASVAPPNVAMYLRVPAHRDECVYEEVPAAGMKVFFHYSVTEGGSLDVDASIVGPDGALVWADEKMQEGRALFKARVPGVHKFCFSNKMSTVTMKTVSFYVQVGDPAESSKGHQVDELERSVVQIMEGLQEVKNEQSYLKSRERIHRDTLESTNLRVVLWSVTEIVALIALAAGQLFYLRRCFEKRRYV